MTATIVGTVETRDEGQFLVWDGGEIALAPTGNTRNLEEGRSVRAAGALDVSRERGVTSMSFTASRVEPTER